jgi:hypothetical protein
MAAAGFKGHPECRCDWRRTRPLSITPRLRLPACLPADVMMARLHRSLVCCRPGARHLPLPWLPTRPSPAPRTASFCRKRYYGENELYQHMHAGHEQCFLCRRSNPHKYVYYRDYADLEGGWGGERTPAAAAAAAAMFSVVNNRGSRWSCCCAALRGCVPTSGHTALRAPLQHIHSKALRCPLPLSAPLPSRHAAASCPRLPIPLHSPCSPCASPPPTHTRH